MIVIQNIQLLAFAWLLFFINISNSDKACDPNDETCAASSGCEDSNEQCRRWASVGECDKNPNYMLQFCQKSCNACGININNNGNGNDIHKQANSQQEQSRQQTPKKKKKRKKIKQNRHPEENLEHTSTTDSRGRKIKYQYGDPDEVQKVDLSSIDTSMCPKNFPNCTSCRDISEHCSFFGRRGECEAHPGWMVMNCGQTCKYCHMHDYYTRCINPLSSPVYSNITHIENSQAFNKPGDLDNLFKRILKYYIEHKFILNDINWEYSVLSKPSYFSIKSLINDIENEYQVKIDIVNNNEIKELINRLIDVESDNNNNLKSKNGPWVVLFDNYMSAEESRGIIDAAPPFERSTDVGKKDGTGHFQQITSTSRTSLNSWCQTECWNKPMVQQVMTRVEDLFNISMDNTEHLQILEYSPGQYYKTHHDYIGQQIQMSCGPRILTFYMYLSDVEEGGETAFPKLKLSVKPKLGRAILWPSVRNDAPNQIDSRTYHEARPVIKGVKYGANSWFHLRDFQTPNIWSCTG